MNVSLFVTCLVDGFWPDVGVSTVKVLRKAGCTVRFEPRQTCCGQPAYNTGYEDEARRVAAAMLDAFEGDDSEAIVMPSGSCSAMVQHAPRLFEGDARRLAQAEAFAARSHELSSFLVDVLGVTEFGSQFDGRVVWHDACHGLRDLGVRDQPRQLLGNVRGLELVEAAGDPTCCGFGGTFSVKQPEVSTAMLDTRMKVLRGAEPDVIVSSDVSCLMQLDGRLRKGEQGAAPGAPAAAKAPRVMHLAEILASGLAALCLLLGSATPARAQEAPSWEQLDERPLPQWFQDAQFGIFIHWGVYSVPAICDTSTYSEWYQHWLDTNSHDGLVRKFHERVYGEDFAYVEFADQFQAELFDADDWAAIFERAGADYIVLTSKHHDGYCLWPDEHSERVRGYPWNSSVSGPKRDLVGELGSAVRAKGIRFGLYYSFLEWHNPLLKSSLEDYVDQQMFPQIQDLIARYEPDIFWPDGEWEHPEETWRGREILEWIRTNAPNKDELVVNDRWGKGCRGEHGDYYTTEYGGHGGAKTYLGQKPFEECRGIGHSFAFNRLEGYDVYLSRTECVRTLIDLVSRGGKLLLDIGPDDDGTIPLIMVDRLLAIGRWLDENGEAIHGCTRSPFQETPWGRATQDGSTLFLHVYDWPANGDLAVPGLASPVSKASFLRDASGAPLALRRSEEGVLHVDLDGHLPSEHATVIRLELDGELRIDEGLAAASEAKSPETPDGPTEAEISTAVRQRCDELCAKLRAGDLASVAAAYRDDAVLHRLGGTPVTGRAAIDAYWQSQVGRAKDWRLETYSIQVIGGAIQQTGRSTLTVMHEGQERESVVDFSLTWQRTEAGELQIVSDVYWPVHD